MLLHEPQLHDARFIVFVNFRQYVNARQVRNAPSPAPGASGFVSGCPRAHLSFPFRRRLLPPPLLLPWDCAQKGARSQMFAAVNGVAVALGVGPGTEHSSHVTVLCGPSKLREAMQDDLFAPHPPTL